MTSYGTSGPNEFEFETGYLSPVSSEINVSSSPFSRLLLRFTRPATEEVLLYKPFRDIMLQVKRQGGSERILFRARSNIVKQERIKETDKASLSSKISGSTQLRESGVFLIAFPKIEISVTGVF